MPVDDRKTQLMLSQQERDSEGERRLRLKGQMIFMEEWEMIMFLGTPVMPKLTSLISTGLYINDLSMHDFSRYISILLYFNFQFNQKTSIFQRFNVGRYSTICRA